MSYKRMRETEARLRDEVASRFQRADAEDIREDAEHGERRGDEISDCGAPAGAVAIACAN